MPATQSREDLLGLYKGEIHRSSTGRTMAGKSAGATVIELGITLGLATPGCCLRCRVSQDSQRSTSQYLNVFCSEHCEQEFIRTRSLRSHWKTASACTSGWKISSCQLRNPLLHHKKEWGSYGKEAIEAYGSAKTNRQAGGRGRCSRVLGFGRCPPDHGCQHPRRWRVEALRT